jgi:hypothetical protein
MSPSSGILTENERGNDSVRHPGSHSIRKMTKMMMMMMMGRRRRRRRMTENRRNR